MLLSKTLDIGPYAGVTFLSGNACEGGQVTGLDSLFYPEFRRFDFRGISRPTCQILFFIRIQIAFLSGFWFEIEIFGAMTENG